jgi:parallel beta helix pectate lyase-like protein
MSDKKTNGALLTIRKMAALSVLLRISRLKAARGSLFTLLLLFACDAGSAHAKAIYVSPNGNDNNPGSLARPVASPSQAVEMAAPGDTVYLRAGRYTINRFIWVSKPGLTIASHPGERAAVVGGTSEEPNNPNSMFIIVANNVTLSDLEIQGGSYYGVKVDLENAPATIGVVLRRCFIHHTGRDAVKTFNADRLLIEDCEIAFSGVRDGSNAEGIDSIGSVGVTIRGCYIHDTATNGLYLKGAARDGVVERNRVERAGHSGILLGQDTDLEYMRDGARHEAINCVARNNIIIEARAAGLGTYSGSNIRFENNTVYDVAKVNQAGLWVVTNTREVPSERVSFKNNIIVLHAARPMIFVHNLRDQLVADSNIYYSSRKFYEFRREIKLPSEQMSTWSLADWKQNMKVDARSRAIDPMLDESNLLRPRTASPAVDRGETLSEVKTDYSGNPRPQGAGLDIGAHEAPAGFGATAGTEQADDDRAGQSSAPAAPTATALAVVLIGAAGGGVVAAVLLFRSRGSRRCAARARQSERPGYISDRV